MVNARRQAEVLQIDAEALSVGELLVLPHAAEVGVDLDGVADVADQDERRPAVVLGQVAGVIRGAMVGRADKGLIITTGSFTADARREAVRDGAPAIDLVDGETLCELLKELRIGVSVRMVEDVQLGEQAFLNL